MIGAHCKGTCENNQKLRNSRMNMASHIPVNRLESDHIYNIMTRIRNGLCLTSNPKNFTNKFVPTHDPLVRLRQNHINEVEVTCPLPIKELNILSPSTCEELRAIVTTYFRQLPQCDLAFTCNDIAKRIEEKEYIQDPKALRDIDEANDNFQEDDFQYKLTADDFSPENHFALNATQAGKWFPGMYTVYPDNTL